MPVLGKLLRSIPKLSVGHAWQGSLSPLSPGGPLSPLVAFPVRSSLHTLRSLHATSDPDVRLWIFAGRVLRLHSRTCREDRSGLCPVRSAIGFVEFLCLQKPLLGKPWRGGTFSGCFPPTLLCPAVRRHRWSYGPTLVESLS